MFIPGERVLSHQQEMRSHYSCSTVRRPRQKNSPWILQQLGECTVFTVYKLSSCMAFLIITIDLFNSIHPQRKEKQSNALTSAGSFSCGWRSQAGGSSPPASVLALSWLNSSPAVLALDPHPVHGELLPSVHLEPPVYKVLHFLKSCLSEQLMKLIWSQTRSTAVFY